MEVGGNNRSVMPLDVLGRTRATLAGATSVYTLASRGLRNLGTPAVMGIGSCNF